MDNNNYLVIDALRIPDAKFICAKHDEIWEPLYLSTIWQPQIDNSPIWIHVNEKSTALEKWNTERQWASSGVLFSFPNSVPQEDATESLKRNITISSEDNRLWLLRFYSPYTISKIAASGNSKEMDSILGLASSAHISPLLSDKYTLRSIENQYSGTSKTIFSNELVEELLP